MDRPYFKDGKRIDYVLVFSTADLDKDSSKMDILKNYIKNLQSEGLRVELVNGQVSYTI